MRGAVTGHAVALIALTVGAVALPNVARAQTPVVTIQATDASASEVGPATGTFTLTRTGSTASALGVSYTIGGTAVNGGDYTAISAGVTFGA
ncbi:MAG: hypothetical protein ACREQL_01810, partial [Candidatus Binatia bacterium]